MELPPDWPFDPSNLCSKGGYIASTYFMGILIGALAGGVCFVVFGFMRTVYLGGFLMLIILNKLKGRPVEQSPFVRIMVAAGVIVSIVLGTAAAMLLGGAVGGVVEYALTKIT